MLTMQGGDSLVGGLPIIHITYQQYIANPSAYHDPDVIVHISGFPTAGNLPADYVGYDEDLNMEDIGNIATKAIAKVEPSDTALYLHNVGDGFINKDGDYCITDVQIAVGGTIVLGTNCHVVDGGISSNLGMKLVYTTTANNESYGTVLSRIFSNITVDDTKDYILKIGTDMFHSINVSSTVLRFSRYGLATSYAIFDEIRIGASNVFMRMRIDSTPVYSELTNQTTNDVFRLYKIG